MQINIDIDGNVFNPIYRPYLGDSTYTQIFYGGSSSGNAQVSGRRAFRKSLRIAVAAGKAAGSAVCAR